MPDPSQMILQFSLMMGLVYLVTVVALNVRRVRSKPRGTYGKGLPERRRRPRLVLPDPCTLQPRPVPPGATI